MKMVIGMVPAATIATRIGMMRITTRITVVMAISSSCRKLSIESSTTCFWSVMVHSCTSAGICCLMLASFSLMAVPIFDTSWPFLISTDSSRHFVPLLVMYDLGLAYSRFTVATSFRRTLFPLPSV